MVRWSERARRDLSNIGQYIARDDARAARSWVRKLQDRAERAADAPMAGRAVPEAQRADVREVFLGAYRLVYRVVDGDIHLLTIFEGHRLFPADVLPRRDDTR